MTKGKTYNNKVFVIPDKVQEKVGSLYSAEQAQKKATRGTVAYSNDNLDLKEGDIIHYNKHAGQPFVIDDTEYLLMSDDDVYLIEHA